MSRFHSIIKKIKNCKKSIFPTLISTNGTGSIHNISKLRFGLKTIEILSTKLLSIPEKIWTIQEYDNEITNTMLIIGFDNLSIVFKMTHIITEYKKSGVLTNVRTLHCCKMNECSIVQVSNQTLDTYYWNPTYLAKI